MRRRALVILAVAVVFHATSSGAANNSTVVSATITSATNLTTSSCASGTPGVTDFGTVLPSIPVVTTADCTVTFGSSNDTSMLRIVQADGYGSAMYTASRGALDTTFDTDGLQSWVSSDPQVGSQDGYAMAVGTDGKPIVTGDCYHNITNNDACTERFTTTGAPDPTWDGDGNVETPVAAGFQEDWMWDVLVQPDGKVVTIGECYMGAVEIKDLCVIRYSSTGVLDPTFDGDGIKTVSMVAGANDYGYAGALQPDGSIVVAGECGAFGANDDFCAIRLTSTGALDPFFDGDGKQFTAIAAAGFDRAYGVDVQSDGKIVLAGNCSMGGATGVDFCAVRYDANGALDPTWDSDGKLNTPIGPGTNGDTARASALQADGKLVVAGYCNMGAATGNDFCVARYTTTGALDPTFDGDGIATTAIAPGAGADTARSMVIQGDGKIVLAGYCAMGAPSGTDGCLVRYNTNGSLDLTFDGDGIKTIPFGPAAASDSLYGIAQRPDGGLVAAGDCYDGTKWVVCVVALGGRGTIAQYADTSTDWDQGSSMFGACLRATTATAVWTTTGTCAMTDGPTWNAVPTTATKIATAASTVTTATASLRFGMRASSTQPEGLYTAPVIFEVLAPAV